LVGHVSFDADGNEAAIALARAAYGDALANCDHALISGAHGQIVLEFNRDA
jgi:hypothetical protein